jgi:ring-1,2-phenylacetyl-CoA epoxidase subunit PaaC
MDNLKNLVYKLADSQMILGHRNSEWTGIAPILEEDIAFASMAQDKIGHALALYTLLHENMGEADPDTIAFSRKASEWKNAILTEIYTQDYGFALIRHFLFDQLEAIRFESLKTSSMEPLAQLAKKFSSEIKYHTMHGDIWFKNLATGSEEAKARVQTALNECFEYANGLFEKVEDEQSLIDQGLYIGEEALKAQWLDKVSALIEEVGLTVPTMGDKGNGSLNGMHSEDLQPMLSEMTEVYDIEPSAEW